MNHRTVVLPVAILCVSVATIALADTFTVVNTDDTGAGSLRAALTSAQSCGGGPHTIAFNIPTASLINGVAVITPASALPVISCAGTLIDGMTQTVNQGNTNDLTLGAGGLVGTGPDGRTGTGDEATLPQLNGPEVEIVGSNLTGSTLVIQANDVIVRGLSVHGGGDFNGFGQGSASIEIQSGTGVLIEKNVIGASARSYAAPVGMAQTQSNLILVGGGSSMTIQQNLMGFARWRSLLIHAPADTMSFQQNEIVGSADGIDFNSVGTGPLGTITVARNYFHDFVDNGSGSNIFGAFVTQTDGVANFTENTMDNVGFAFIVNVGRPVTVQHNVLTNAAGTAVLFLNGSQPMPLTVTENSIFLNGGLGIDLTGDGITPNDVGDADTGPNNLQNFPVLTSVNNGGGNTTIAGTLNSTPNTTFRLEFYANDAVDSTGYGEGQFFLGFTNVTTDGSGNVSFNAVVPQVPGNQRVTATATDPQGNTSEFSAAIGQLLNISTRLRVQTGENVLIGGFIITGTDPKRVIVRAIGPSLAQFFPDFLPDPTLELHGPAGFVTVMNDNWKIRSDGGSQQAEIEATGLAPTNDLESALVQTLPANAAYTAVVVGKNNSTGIGVVEAYDLDTGASSKLANISTRGFVETGNNVLIGGLIAGNGVTKVIVRAIGPSLTAVGIAGALPDPTLELHDGTGALVASNNNWRIGGQEDEIKATGIPPTNDLESAIVATLAPGAYTAVVAGDNGTTGVGLVEVYNIP